MIIEKRDSLQHDFSLFTEGRSQEALSKLQDFFRIQHLFNSAIREISAKLETLDDEFQILYAHNPIHHMESRLKTPISIADKLRRKGLEINTRAALDNLSDIAGVRVICYYLEDVYRIADMLLRQDDITLLERVDYIEHPKENGYRSLHLVIRIPIFLSTSTEQVAVEVQLRTIPMDYWASVEHQLTYKKDTSIRERFSPELLACAEEIHELECRMQQVRNLAVPQDEPPHAGETRGG